MKTTSPFNRQSVLLDFLNWDYIYDLIVKLPALILTCTYSGAYKYHTRNPIDAIRHHQNQEDATIKNLVNFRQAKIEELRFVQGAATLSGAAVIGGFSWPTTEKTIWATKMLWNWSLFLSSFALIGSAHQRLLRHLPAAIEEDFGEQKLKIALSLFLQPVIEEESDTPPSDSEMRRVSRKMLWFWQCPTMLMSYSWVFFLVGYALHLLTPIFDPSQAEVSRVVAGLTLTPLLNLPGLQHPTMVHRDTSIVNCRLHTPPVWNVNLSSRKGPDVATKREGFSTTRQRISFGSIVRALAAAPIPITLEEWRKSKWYFGEYLTQGRLDIRDRCSQVSLQKLIDRGLFTLIPTLKARNSLPKSARTVVDIRESLRLTKAADMEHVSLAIDMARGTVREEFVVPFSIMLFALRNPLSDDRSIVTTMRSAFMDVEMDINWKELRYDLSSESMEELKQFEKIMESL
ncbi:hypothetical protein FHETE_2228 [Fusarium heterosporum]|uniref:Uncharacterized protein n=1 Tax=Fusarium heterosporum TaxID=42747 RepID=A0A8H5TU03_FUSHE|nr:hypothetical protein FHETE_2228 [Fusarium heterosporum]